MLQKFLLQQGQVESGLTLAITIFTMVLLVVTLIYVYQSWILHTEGLSKITSRIRFLWVLTIVFMLSALYSYKLLLIYIAFVAFLGLKEFLSITPTRRTDRRVLLWAYLSIPLQFFFIWQGWFELFILFIPVHVFLILPMVMVLIGDTEGFLRAWSMLGWGIITTVYTLGFLACVMVLPTLADRAAEGIGLALFLVGLAQINHAMHYIFGRRFSNPKLALPISETRNWASLIGGVLITIPLAWLLAPLITPFSGLDSIWIGILISVSSFIGYIILSAIKTSLNLRDRGSMTPGSGGVLNRIDTFVYAAPLYFYIVRTLYF